MSPPSQTQVAIIGAGPAGLMAAEVLAQGGAGVTVYDAMPSAGRKFLMAGRGGLNLTHSEALPAFLARYGAATPHLAAGDRGLSAGCICANGAKRWGSRPLSAPAAGFSRRRSRPRRCCARGCGGSTRWACNSRCGTAGPAGMRRAACCFKLPMGNAHVDARATVLALGGASWPRLGSDGAWVETLAAKGVTISPLRPANCGFTVAWSDIFRDRFEGHPLKGVALSFGPHTVRGEAVITRTGIEGGAIYALSADLREAIVGSGQATLRVALRPDLEMSDLIARLSAPRGKQSFSNWLRKAAHLSPVGIGLLQEAAIASGAPLSSLSPASLAGLINAVPIKLNGIAPIARAISTAGGISFDELDADFMIRRLPGIFAAGEMLDWEAPTGGYLLQASFATGAAAGRGALKWLKK